MGLFSGSGLTPSLKGVNSNVEALKPGQVDLLSPAGWYAIRTGPYTVIQQYDPITQTWRTIGGGVNGGGIEYIYSDGVNYRLANQNGCVVGVIITNVGSGYSATNPPTITTTTGAVFKAIVGGAVSQTVTVTNGGVNYTYAPQVVISAPPAGGIQATGYCTLTSGVVTSVTIVDQGAGYASTPNITFFNDPREGLNGLPTGYNAAVVATLTGAGTVTGVLVLDHGNPVAVTAGTATAIPTLTINNNGGSSFAATAIMNWSIVGLVSSGYVAGVLTGGPTSNIAWISGIDQPATPNATVLNASVQANLVRTRQAVVSVAIASGTFGAYTTAVVRDGGVYTGTPLPVLEFLPGTAVATAPVLTFVMGPAVSADVTYLTQM